MANIFKIAKQIQKKHPSKSWKDCVSMAGRQMKSGNKTTHKKTSMPGTKKARPRAKKKPAGTAKPHKRITARTYKAKAKKLLEDELGKLVVKQFNQTKVRLKKKIGKKIAEKKAEIRRLK